MALANKVIYQNGAIREFEKPEVCEAIKVANANRWTVGLSPIEWDEREARLKKEHENHANASDKMGMTLKEAKDILKKEFEVIGIHKSTEPFEFDESRWIEHEKPSVLEAFRILSKEGYYITISGHDYDMRKKRLQKEYEENTKAPGPGEEQPKEGNYALKEAASKFNDALLDEQAKKIEELTKDKELIKKASLSQLDDFIEIYNLLTKESQKTKRLGKEIAKLNSIIHDKNAVLTDVSEELRLTKIREKNLAELGLKYVGENEKLKKKLADKIIDEIDAQALKSAESALAYKDEVIETLEKELAEAKHELSSLKRPFRPDSTEAVILFANAYAKAEKKHLRCAEWRNDGKEVSITYILKNGKKSKITLDFTGDEIIFSRTDPDKKPSIPTPEEPKHDNIFEDFINKTICNYNRRAAELGCAGSKDGNGIFDQMVGTDIAEEGCDNSGVTVLCGTDFVKLLKENEGFIHDLFEKKHKEIKEFMYDEAEQFFEGDGIPTKMEVMKPSRKFKKIK